MLELLLALGLGAAWAAVLHRLMRRRSQTPSAQPQPTSGQPTETRPAPVQFGVRDQAGNHVTAHTAVKDAIRSWTAHTDQAGTITDFATGQDVTPKRDPLIVRRFKQLLEWLRRKLGQPVPAGINLQPERPGPSYTDGDLALLAGISPGYDTASGKPLDEKLIAKALEKLLAMKLPIFNIAKKRLDETHTLIDVKRVRQSVRRKEVPDTVELQEPASAVPISSIVPEDDLEVQRIRQPNELLRIIPRQRLAEPRPLIAKGLVDRSLRVLRFKRTELEEEVRHRAVRITKLVDEPYFEEYVEQMELRREPSAQLLYFLVDGSGSMAGYGAILTAALVISVIRKGMDRQSRFFLRPFDAEPRKETRADTVPEKHEMIRRVCQESFSGGGTDILKALQAAADSIRSVRNNDERAEILLITDGGDSFNRQDVYRITGEDVILHTVNVGAHLNASLQESSSTFVHLDPHDFFYRGL